MESTDDILLEIVTDNAPYTASWLAAFQYFLPIIPMAAALISAIVFIVMWPQYQIQVLHWPETLLPFIIGTLGACLLWAILASTFRRFTAVDLANANSYNALCKRLNYLDYYIATAFPDDTAQQETYNLLNRLKKFPTNKQSAATSPPINNQPAANSLPTTGDNNNRAISQQTLILSYRNAIYAALMEQTPNWTIGAGYIKLWNLMNQAEELLITLEPTEKVLHDAVYDNMRLNQSNIASSDEWGNKLRLALAAISEDATRYLTPSLNLPASTTTDAGNNKLPPATAPHPSTNTPPEQPVTPPSHINGGDQTPPNSIPQPDNIQDKQSQARAILQLIREMINSFNTNNWSGLITTRNRLMSTMLLVGLTTYIATQVAIIIHIKPQHLIGIIVFGLIGALVGLFGRLYQESQTANDIDDYGLGTARLIVVPLLSGLAAIIGVLIVAKVTSFDDLYNIKSILSNFVVVATFGLTPNLVVNQLQKKSDQYTGNLKSTQPTSSQ